ncbi:ADP-ribosylglycohydrolase family protein [Lacrimispora sp. 210928-DFI.3.58]|uniref:ADP-ribosylglycohydrolase family protein n=1 Tax=Lacrimispora sp. 210928-DFI.3.58 TaxID=2883214 RepID=UPI0015B4AC62|nr:ADP-ribosylglycohydrolase family protein [Lacrimispora sp. 210928-DFI.3.58]MCB7318536.1 ADP-ribosylglycohydrolase family protein [Lacrimispora sp. 210928-DFI.3.58]
MYNRDSLLYKKIYGCLLGGLIGDAMGAPTEDLTYQEIEERYGYVEEFEGSGTDDSAIKLVLCDAIIESKGYVTADEFAEAFLRNKEAYYDMFFIPVKNMFHKIESKLELPVYAGLGNMHSSSSAMSISPMGIINACNPRQAALETYDVAGLIHAGVSTFCRDGASAMAAAVAEAMDPQADVESVVEAASAYLHRTSSWEMLENIEKGMRLARETGDYKKFREEFYKHMLRDIVSDSRETIPCVLALFYLAEGDPVKSIQYAANLGRDADTIGAMVGALAGAYAGIDGFRPAWIDKVEATYGQKQKNSKAVKTEAVMPDQRRLAEQLMEIVEKRRQEARRVCGCLDALAETN